MNDTIRTSILDLPRLSQSRSEKSLKIIGGAAWPGSHCPLHVARGMADMLTGLNTLVVGTQECAWHTHVNFSGRSQGGAKHYTYVLSESEIAFGCRKGVLAALRSMAKEGAHIILMIFTCLPDLIGEDAEAIALDAQEEGITALPVLLGHFRSLSYPIGYRKVMLALFPLLAPRPKNAKQVNLIGFAKGQRQTEESELIRELSAAGVSCRTVPQGCSLQEFQKMADAAACVALLPPFCAFAAKMEKEFEVTAVDLGSAYAPADIAAEYQKLFAALKTSSSDSLEKSREEAHTLYGEFKKAVAGKTFVLLRCGETAMALASFLAEAGMQPVFLHAEAILKEDGGHISAILNCGFDPLTGHDASLRLPAEELRALKADVFIGFEGASPLYQAFPFVDPRPAHGQTGYLKSMRLMRDIMAKLGGVR